MNNLIIKNILYASCLSSKHKYEKLFKDSIIKPGQQVQKYHRLITEGMASGNNVKMKILTSLPITRANCNRVFINEHCEIENKIEYNYLPIVNIPLLKNILVFIESFIYTFFFCIKNRNVIMIGDILNISVSAGALFATKLAGVKSVGIVTDLPLYLSNNGKSMTVKINNYIMHRFSSYIFLTEQMNLHINKKNKPYIVIEGLVDINMVNLENKITSKYENKICIYAGGIQKIYGIDYLVNAFIEANVHNSELHIFGDGDFEDELKRICEVNDKIKYFGVKLNDYVVNEQLMASLLINPRPTNVDFTKYSFPSKNMEYMASGTPTLTTKLPGMPEEYNEYVFLIEEETVDGLTQALKDLLSKSKEELHEKGRRAKEFVLSKKNNIVQAKKILDLVNKIMTGKE